MIALPAARQWAHPVATVAIAVAALTASSYVAVPMYPVPMTMQTLAVLLVGAMLGPRAGVAAILAWFCLALAGAPVLAGGKLGITAFVGPTAGYLAAFPFAAAGAGLLARATGSHAIRFVGFAGLHVLILLVGWAWLARFVGPEAAFAAGVTPFLAGALLKSGLATVGLAAVRHPA